MAYQNSPDSEFDPEMESILRAHFDAEAPGLRAPSDPWPWLESRMRMDENSSSPPFFSRFVGMLNRAGGNRLFPAFAAAGVAVIAVAVAAVVWASYGNGGDGSVGDLAALPPSEAETAATTVASSESARAQTGSSSPTSAPQAAASGPAAPSRVAGPSGPAGPSGAVSANDSKGAASTAAPAATAAPAPMASSQPAVVTQESGAQAAPATGFQGSPGPMGSDGSGSPPDTTFKDNQRQPFVTALEDNVSTFSLDTDRTSFQLALSWARAGYEINPDSVRAEEWLNSFDYGYESPASADRFAIRGDLYPHPLDENKRLARIAFTAPELADDTPLNVTLVLDASGSMADGNRVDIARQAAESIRQSLRDGDRIAVVHFTEDVIDQYTVRHSPPDNYRVRDSIAWLQPHGSTNVQAGLNLAVHLADEARALRPDYRNYVILMSDGVANVDATNPFAILESAYDRNALNPLRLITIGVGINNYNDPLLEQLAQHGNGWYRYLDSTEQAAATFNRENWLALSTPFADQTRAQVTWNTGTVKRWRIIGYENRVTADENFTQNRREFAELYSGAATTVLYELELTDAAASITRVPLGRVELRWVDPDTGGNRYQTASLSGSPAAGFQGRDGALARFGAIVALSADIYSGLPYHPESVYAEDYDKLVALQSQLRPLSSLLGSLDAYNDFAFLLNHITEGVGQRIVPSTPSGYSR